MDLLKEPQPKQVINYADWLAMGSPAVTAIKVEADVNVEELSRCVQGVVLQKKSEFRSGPHFPHGFPQWDGPDFCVGKGPARDLVDLICQHFGLTSPDMQVKKKPALRQTRKSSVTKTTNDQHRRSTGPHSSLQISAIRVQGGPDSLHTDANIELVLDL